MATGFSPAGRARQAGARPKRAREQGLSRLRHVNHGSSLDLQQRFKIDDFVNEMAYCPPRRTIPGQHPEPRPGLHDSVDGQDQHSTIVAPTALRGDTQVRNLAAAGQMAPRLRSSPNFAAFSRAGTSATALGRRCHRHGVRAAAGTLLLSLTGREYLPCLRSRTSEAGRALASAGDLLRWNAQGPGWLRTDEGAQDECSSVHDFAGSDVGPILFRRW